MVDNRFLPPLVVACGETTDDMGIFHDEFRSRHHHFNPNLTQALYVCIASENVETFFLKTLQRMGSDVLTDAICLEVLNQMEIAVVVSRCFGYVFRALSQVEHIRLLSRVLIHSECLEQKEEILEKELAGEQLVQHYEMEKISRVPIKAYDKGKQLEVQQFNVYPDQASYEARGYASTRSSVDKMDIDDSSSSDDEPTRGRQSSIDYNDYSDGSDDEWMNKKQPATKKQKWTE